MATKNLVLRTVYIDPDVDDALRNEAFDRRTSKNDLLREYLRLGMQMAAQAYVAGPSEKQAAAKHRAPKTLSFKEAKAITSAAAKSAKSTKSTTRVTASGKKIAVKSGATTHAPEKRVSG